MTLSLSAAASAGWRRRGFTASAGQTQEAQDGKMVEWMEHVTDEQYLAGPPEADGGR